MARSLRGALSLCFVLGLVSACASSEPAPQPAQSPPPSQQPPPAAPQGACGVQLFMTPACQAALDQVCCPIAQECAKDPACLRLAQCVMGCRTQGGDNCANGCAVRSHYEYCNAACQGQGNDCVTICGQKSSPTEPMVKFVLIGHCSKGVRYPADVRCNDHS